MDDERRLAQRYNAEGTIVFYRREHEVVEREHLGILENIGASGLLLSTGEQLPTGAVLLMRIYSPVAPAGTLEVAVRGTVQRYSENPKGVGILFLDTSGHEHEALRGLIAALAPALHPAPVLARANSGAAAFNPAYR